MNPVTPGLVARHLLPTYYAKVVPLRTYLSEVSPSSLVPCNESFHDAATVSAAWQLILDGLVAMPNGIDAPSSREGGYGLDSLNHVDDHAAVLHNVLEQAQYAIYTQRRRDILLLGFHYSAGRLVQTHWNSIVQTFLENPAWHLLLQRMGSTAFMRLLCSTAYFFPAAPDHDCYVQMWGVPLTELPPPSTSVEKMTPSRSVHAAQIYLRRSRLFHARATHVYRYGIALGLPPTHAFHLPMRWSQMSHMERRMHTARILRDMMPHDFGYPFGWERAHPTHSPRRRRWPKGLGCLSRFVSCMLRRHDKCRYDMILDACCPSVLPRGRVLRARRMELVSQFAGLDPQAATASTSTTSGSTCASALSAPYVPHGMPPFLHYATPPGRVVWFVCVVLRKLLPSAMVGSQHNWAIIRRAVHQFVHARRFERVTLHDTLQGFKSRDCGAWLAHRDPTQTQMRLCSWMWWLMDALVLPLLRTSFYATETAVFRRRVLYFRQDVWVRVTTPLIRDLCTQRFSRVSAVPWDGCVPYATVRLLPKETAVRPIVNLGRRPQGFGRSINAQLQNALAVLTYESTQQSHMCGAAISSVKAMYAKLKMYKDHVFSHGSRRLYLVRADIRAAFDSLHHTRLLELVRMLLPRHATYVIQRYAQVRPGIGLIRRCHTRRAYPAETSPAFMKHAAEQPSRHAVLVDGITYTTVSATDVMKQVEAHVKQTFVRFGDALYRQTTGIPQGSILSTLLCNLVLADAERTYLYTESRPGVKEQPVSDADDCLLRFTDDFLYLTPSLERAQRMCVALHAGFPLHGCQVAREKSLVNFDAYLPDGYVVRRVAPHVPFPWCGVCIDPTSLALLPDPDRDPHHLGDTLTIRRITGLAPMLLHAMHARTRFMFTDTHLNTTDGAYTNLLEGFVVAAAKLHVYLRSMTHVHVLHVQRSVVRAVRSIYPMVRASLREAQASFSTVSDVQLRRDCIEWLGFFAFARVLQRWQVHSALASAFANYMQAPQYARARGKIGRLAISAWTTHRQRIAQMT